jgi:hypothetical protein
MPSSLQTNAQILRTIRLWLSFFILALVLSGLTAFPLEHETNWFASFLHAHPILPSPIIFWITKVGGALRDTGLRYPFLAYGTDWLAFAHLVLAIAFLGPLRNPLRNKWVFQFGVIACISVVFLALIAGPIRGIPFFWRLIDCSFGLFGVIPLLICLRLVNRLQTMK